MTQAQVAAAMTEVDEPVEVDPSLISHWESGRREPKTSELVAWAKVLGLEPGELFKEENGEPAEEAAVGSP